MSNTIKRYKKSLLRLFERVHELYNNPNSELCLSIQEDLILRISLVEKRLRNNKEQVKELRRLLKTPQVPMRTKEESNALKQIIKYKEVQIDEYQQLLVIFRHIGDAIAFTYIDNWDIKPLAYKEAPGFISGKKGSRLERRVVRAVHKQGHVAILNDLTTCLRYGDVTVPENGQALIMELKSSKQVRNNSTKQIKNLEHIVDYLEKDYTDKLYSVSGEIYRCEISKKETQYRSIMQSLCEYAMINGIGIANPEEGLSYLVIKREYVDTDAFKIAIDLCGLQPIAAYVNSKKYENTAYFPFTLSLYPAEVLYKFYLDDINIIVFISFEIFQNHLLEKGFKSELLGEEDYCISIEHNEPHAFGTPVTKISRHFFDRIAIEFLSLEWFINETIYLSTNLIKKALSDEEKSPLSDNQSDVVP